MLNVVSAGESSGRPANLPLIPTLFGVRKALASSDQTVMSLHASREASGQDGCRSRAIARR